MVNPMGSGLGGCPRTRFFTKLDFYLIDKSGLNFRDIADFAILGQAPSEKFGPATPTPYVAGLHGSLHL